MTIPLVHLRPQQGDDALTKVAWAVFTCFLLFADDEGDFVLSSRVRRLLLYDNLTCCFKPEDTGLFVSRSLTPSVVESPSIAAWSVLDGSWPLRSLTAVSSTLRFASSDNCAQVESTKGKSLWYTAHRSFVCSCETQQPCLRTRPAQSYLKHYIQLSVAEV